MPIDILRAAQKFATNAANAANDYVVGATGAASQWERNAKSPEAEKNYATGVTMAVQNQLRAKGLAGVTAQDYSNGVQANANVYQQKVGQSQEKWTREFTPYANLANSLEGRIPARNPSASPAQNYANRGDPYASGFKALRLSGVTGQRFAGPAPVRR